MIVMLTRNGFTIRLLSEETHHKLELLEKLAVEHGVTEDMAAERNQNIAINFDVNRNDTQLYAPRGAVWLQIADLKIKWAHAILDSEFDWSRRVSLNALLHADLDA